MGQIMSLANSLGGETQQDEADPSSQEREEGNQDAPDLSALLSSVLGGMDPNMVQMVLRLVSEYGAGLEEKNVALLTALRPFLKEKRQAKMDQAMQLAKLSRVARVAFSLLKGGDEPV